MRVSVLVPSYRRPVDLARCLAAIRLQTHAPDSVIVVLRTDDQRSRALVEHAALSWPAIVAVLVDRPGVVAAMNAGLAMATGDILALTDDDAEPNVDWLQRLLGVFASDPKIAGVGGRDDQHLALPRKRSVGRLQWFGRLIGNHHLGRGPARDVDVLKGVNCAFRLQYLRSIGFDERLLGRGAQVHWELALCLALRRANWRLVYDPEIVVRHYVANRQGDEAVIRGQFTARPHHDAVFNETLLIAEHLRGLPRLAFDAWVLGIGTSEAPGLLQLPRAVARDGRAAITRWRVTQRARRAGLTAALRRV